MERFFKPIPKVKSNRQIQSKDTVNHKADAIWSESESNNDGYIDEFSEEEAPTVKPHIAYNNKNRGIMLKALYYREVGRYGPRCQSPHLKGHMNVIFNHLLAARLQIRKTETQRETVGKSVAVFNSTGEILAIGDSRPSVMIYRFTELDNQDRDSGEACPKMSEYVPMMLLGSGAFRSDLVTSISWDPVHCDKFAVSMAFDPDIQVFDINHLLTQGQSSSIRYRSNHIVGHDSILYNDEYIENKAYIVAGGTRGHIRCWKKEQPKKPMWVVKKTESAVRALAWVKYEDKTDTDPKTPLSISKKVPEVLNSKCDRMGLKRKRPLNDLSMPLVSTQRIPQHDNRKPQCHKTKPTLHSSNPTIRKVLVATFSDGTLSIWDIDSVKVRLLGSQPTPTLIATLTTQDLFHPLVHMHSCKAPVHALPPSNFKSQVVISLTNGWRASFHLSKKNGMLSLVPAEVFHIRPASDRSRLVDCHGSMVHCHTLSGARARVIVDPCFLQEILHLQLEQRDQAATRRILAKDMVSVLTCFGNSAGESCRHITIVANPQFPCAVVFINYQLFAILQT